MNYGIQLYSMRDLSEKDFEAAVKKAAELGYGFIEFAGFFGRTAEQINALLKENNLTVSGTHSSFDDLINNYEETVAFHKAIGNKNYIVPWYDLSSQEKIDVFITKANEIIPRLRAEGIELGFHNHSAEFIPNPDGSVAFEQLLYRSDIKLEVDTYWAFVGMKNPIALLKRLGDRLIFCHVKDGTPEGNGFPLGMGSAPVAEVYEFAVNNGIPMVVESETCNPSGPAEAEICINYLRTLEK